MQIHTFKSKREKRKEEVTNQTIARTLVLWQQGLLHFGLFSFVCVQRIPVSRATFQNFSIGMKFIEYWGFSQLKSHSGVRTQSTTG